MEKKHSTKKTTAAKSKQKPKVISPKVRKPKAPMPETALVGLHNLKVPQGAHKRKKLLGRGPSSGHGKTSTRGSKGQTSRAGRDFYAGFEGWQTPLIRRIPKRGFTSIFKKEYQIVNLDDLKNIKEQNITLDLLEAKGLIKNKARAVKILANGELNNPLTIQAHAFSKSAIDKIQKAGGKSEIINVNANL